jgi:uroporphyrinogen III methyltransferase/synthase
VKKRSVVVTRDEPANGPLSTNLRELGLQVLAWPVIKVSPPADAAPFEQALAHAAEFDWIAFASQHAVAAVTARLNAVPRRERNGEPVADASRVQRQPSAAAAPHSPRSPRIAAVGKRTAEVLQDHGWPVDLVPDDATAEGLVSALTPFIAPGSKVLFPASSRALPTLAAGLRKLGADVLEVEAYRTEAAPLDIDDCRSLIDHEAIGAVTFTSPSAVTELDQALGEMHFDRLLSHSAIIALGPTTGRALVERGHQPVLADPQTLQGLATTTARLLMQTRS